MPAGEAAAAHMLSDIVMSFTENSGAHSDMGRAFLYCDFKISGHTHGENSHRDIINGLTFDVNS
jgi:hypothetical protein